MTVTSSDNTAPTTAEATTERPEYKSYWDIVWGQFQKYRLSYLSLWGVGALFVIAILAPVFALDVPFYASVPAGVGPEVTQGLSFPWFTALFDANFFESGIDIFFNSLIFLLPLFAVAWLVVRQIRTFDNPKAYRRFRTRFLLFGSVVVLALTAVLYFMMFRQPYVDWVALSGMDGVRALFPPMEYSYREPDLSSVQLGMSWEHWLGTDREGRDVFTRLLYGTRISLTIGVVAVAIYVSIGIVLGSLAGYFGGWVDMAVLRLIEVMICFPALFLIMTLSGFIEDPSIFYIMIIIGLTGWPSIARLVRAEFLRLKNQEFVHAAQALGFKQSQVIFRHILPNGLGPVFVSATFGVAGAILVEASLSFLGLGPASAPSWGQILTTGRETGQWSLILAPGLAIFVTVTLLNLVGEGVRDAIDPKLRK